MSRGYVKFAGLDILLAEGWCDITDDLPNKTPFSLAKSQDGIGVLQVSAATYKAGPRPYIGINQLEEMFEDFCVTNHLDRARNIQLYNGVASFISGDFISNDEFIRAWYVTDGSSVALITYLSGEPEANSLNDELLDASAMIQSIRFSDVWTFDGTV